MVRIVRTPHGIVVDNDDDFCIDTLSGLSSYKSQPKKAKKARQRKRKEVTPRPEAEQIQLGNVVPEITL